MRSHLCRFCSVTVGSKHTSVCAVSDHTQCRSPLLCPLWQPQSVRVPVFLSRTLTEYADGSWYKTHSWISVTPALEIGSDCLHCVLWQYWSVIFAAFENDFIRDIASHIRLQIGLRWNKEERLRKALETVGFSQLASHHPELTLFFLNVIDRNLKNKSGHVCGLHWLIHLCVCVCLRVCARVGLRVIDCISRPRRSFP